MKTIKHLPPREELDKHFVFDFETGKVFRRMHPDLMTVGTQTKEGSRRYIVKDGNQFIVLINIGGRRYYKAFYSEEEAIEDRDAYFRELYPTGLEEVLLTPDDKGYINFRWKRSTYKLHRILYYMFHNEDLGNMQIDHIDQNKSNNNINNLRLADNSQQNMNRKIQSNNKSGVRGVHHHRTKPKGSKIYYDYWLATIWGTVDGKRKILWSKMYPFTDEGLNDAKLNITEARARIFGTYSYD